MSASKTNPGRYFEDFRLGETLNHATPRTVSEADAALYLALTGTRFAVNSSDPFAAALGFRRAPLDDFLAFHIVFGKTVPDVSINAVANLGYAEGVFGAPLYPGDTVTAVSEVIGLRENSNRETGTVYVRTRGTNQHGGTIVEYVRWVMVRKRDSRPSPREADILRPRLGAAMPTEAAVQAELRAATDEALSRLSPREADILRLRFGIGSAGEHTLEEVGRKYQVTRKRIREIEDKALKKLAQRTQGRAAPAPSPSVPNLASAVPPDSLVVPEGLDPSRYDRALAGSPLGWDDYAVGERIDHADGVTIEEAEHAMATRLYQNTAKVHFNQHSEKAGRFGRRLIYGGHVISLARALSFNGLGNAFRIAALNGGRHVAPCFAGDTVYAWSEVLEKAELGGRGDVGALRLRTIAAKDHSCADFPDKSGETYHPAVILDLDYWVLMPR